MRSIRPSSRGGGRVENAGNSCEGGIADRGCRLRVVGLLGPTAAGKARLAVEAASQAGAILLSCDSMKVYRGMDVGTAKPAPAQRPAWRGLDLVDPWERYDASRFRQL